MGQGVGGGGSARHRDPLKEIGEKKINALVVQDVKIVTKEYQVDVPKYVQTEQVKYNTTQQQQIKYNEVERDTIKYNVVEKETIKFTPREEDTIKFVTKEVEVERPVYVDKPYERPVIKSVEYAVATVKDLEGVRELLDTVPQLRKELAALKEELDKLKHYTLAEEVVKVQKVQFIPIEVERITWKDVERERSSNG